MNYQKDLQLPVISERLQRTLFILLCGGFCGFVWGVVFTVIFLRGVICQ